MAPVVYNTWFDQFEILDVPRLRSQLAAAQEVGCEAFVIDAGWYGAGGSWWEQVGDWREKTETAFRGKMLEFADEVRATGLGFGLWIEPERFGPAAPIRKEHPEWFVPVGGAARIDLTRPAAYSYLRAEIGRLVETYGLAWMKLDSNFTFDPDASGAELSEYADAWHRLLDEIRSAYPDTFFEGCSSGAMRCDIATLAHFDGHFLSDTVNPADVLRISQGAWLRLLPGRLGRWVVVRPAGSSGTVLTPRDPPWQSSESVDLSFAILAAMPGMMGFSGDLAGLEPASRGIIAAAVAFFKEWRCFITGSMAHLLTPPAPLTSREGWVAVQLQQPGEDTSLVFVYRLGSAGKPPAMRMRDLREDTRYAIERGFGAPEEYDVARGGDLMRRGLSVRGMDDGCQSAEVFVVRRTE